MLAAEQGDGAKVAGVVTAFGDFQKRIMRRGELRALIMAQAVLEPGNVRDQGCKTVVVFKGHPLADLGQVALQVIEITLGQVASDEQLSVGFRSAAASRMCSIDSRLASSIKPQVLTRIRSAFGRSRVRPKVTAPQRRRQVLRIGEVLRAAQTDQRGAVGWIWGSRGGYGGRLTSSHGAQS